MAWDVEYTDQFGEWFATLSESVQDSVITAVEYLEEFGPGLGRPWCDTISTSRHANMKELRPRESHVRILLAFDPRRSAILLIGGDNQGNWRRFYKEIVPEADRLYDEHLRDLRQEGSIP